MSPKAPRPQPTADHRDLSGLAQRAQGVRESHYLFLRKSLSGDYSGLTVFLVNLHFQHAPTFLTAFILARAQSVNGPRRPEAAEAAEALLPTEFTDFESKTIS